MHGPESLLPTVGSVAGGETQEEKSPRRQRLEAGPVEDSGLHQEEQVG